MTKINKKIKKKIKTNQKINNKKISHIIHKKLKNKNTISKQLIQNNITLYIKNNNIKKYSKNTNINTIHTNFKITSHTPSISTHNNIYNYKKTKTSLTQTTKIIQKSKQHIIKKF